MPLANPDFAPFLQRARDHSPDALFVFVPASQAATFAKQFVERGLDKSGIKLIGPGDITDDNDLPYLGDQMIGTITALNYDLIQAMKGLAWESPRGPISIDPETRDVPVYLRKVERIEGELYNSEFATFEAVKDPLKEAKRVAN